MSNKATLKMFSHEYQPNNKKGGRKPTIWKNLKNSNINKEDIINIFKLVLEQSPETLKADFEKIKSNEIFETTKDKPIIYYNIVSAIMKDLKTGSLINIMSILSRWLGQPKQEIEHSGNIKNELSPDQLKILENDLKGIITRKTNE